MQSVLYFAFIVFIDDLGGEKRLAGGDFYLWLKKSGYLEGYQTLCANCNLKKEMMRLRGEGKC